LATTALFSDSLGHFDFRASVCSDKTSNAAYLVQHKKADLVSSS
jgi:hypothetical protein